VNPEQGSNTPADDEAPWYERKDVEQALARHIFNELDLPDIDKKAAERSLARHIINDLDLPRGAVIRLLEDNGIEQSLINRIATKLVPYGHT